MRSPCDFTRSVSLARTAEGERVNGTKNGVLLVAVLEGRCTGTIKAESTDALEPETAVGPDEATDPVRSAHERRLDRGQLTRESAGAVRRGLCVTVDHDSDRPLTRREYGSSGRDLPDAQGHGHAVLDELVTDPRPLARLIDRSNASTAALLPPVPWRSRRS